MGNIALQILIIALANIFLVGRVLWQKRNRQEIWRRQRKLTRQLLIIAVLYILFWFPLTIDGLIYNFTLSPIAGDLQWKYFFFLPSVLAMVSPFVLLLFLPDFRKVVFKFQGTTVTPAINHIPRVPNGET
jgi:uncharacterized iron-regulated membrane protein